MSNVATYVQGLSHVERHAIIVSYEEFEQTGSTGDTPVRIHANAVMAQIGVPSTHITMYMTILAMECYRFYYNNTFR